jgi:hypothetical protein
MRRLITLKIALGKALEDFQDQGTAKIVTWWENADSMFCIFMFTLLENGANLDFYNFNTEELKNLSLMSTFLTKPIAESVSKFLQLRDHDAEQENGRIGVTTKSYVHQVNVVNIPGGNEYIGKRRPLSVSLLLTLSVHSRCRYRNYKTVNNK